MRTRRTIKTGKSAAYGPLETMREWARCLVSAKHAENTWLRIEPERERLAFRIMERFLFMLAGLIVATTFFAIKQYMFFHDVSVTKYNDVTIYSKPR